MDISHIIKTRREELDLKVKDIANAIGIAESTYREWENGRKIQGEPYLLISEALKIPIGELLGVKQRESVQSLFIEIQKLENHVKVLQQNVTQIF